MPAQHPQQGTGELLHMMNIYHQPVFSLNNNPHLHKASFELISDAGFYGTFGCC